MNPRISELLGAPGTSSKNSFPSCWLSCWVGCLQDYWLGSKGANGAGFDTPSDALAEGGV